MRSDHTFHLPLPVDQAWSRLTDLTSVAETTTDGTYRGTLAGHPYRASFLERDDLDHRLLLTARTDPGPARAAISATLHPADSGTRVDVQVDLTDATTTPETVAELIDNLATRLTSPPEPPQPPPPAPPQAPHPSPLRRLALPASIALAAALTGYLLGRHRS